VVGGAVVGGAVVTGAAVVVVVTLLPSEPSTVVVGEGAGCGMVVTGWQAPRAAMAPAARSERMARGVIERWFIAVSNFVGGLG
jgi:hypothetical protein